MARCCWVDIAGGAAQGENIWVETGLVDQILEEKVGAVEENLSERGISGSSSKHLLLERANSIIGSVIQII